MNWYEIEYSVGNSSNRVLGQSDLTLEETLKQLRISKIY